MIIGIPKEIKEEEYRVGITPYGVEELKRNGHTILLETGANATLPYIKTLADKGIERSIREDYVIKSALNTYKGRIVHKALADSMGIAYINVDEIRNLKNYPAASGG